MLLREDVVEIVAEDVNVVEELHPIGISDCRWEGAAAIKLPARTGSPGVGQDGRAPLGIQMSFISLCEI